MLKTNHWSVSSFVSRVKGKYWLKATISLLSGPSRRTSNTSSSFSFLQHISVLSKIVSFPMILFPLSEMKFDMSVNHWSGKDSSSRTRLESERIVSFSIDWRSTFANKETLFDSLRLLSLRYSELFQHKHARIWLFFFAQLTLAKKKIRVLTDSFLPINICVCAFSRKLCVASLYLSVQVFSRAHTLCKGIIGILHRRRVKKKGKNAWLSLEEREGRER